jgi:transcriptional regulator with XRE-family HTH domain
MLRKHTYEQTQKKHNMKLTENYIVAKDFERLFDFSEKDQLSLDALWIAAQFLSKVQDEMDIQQMTRKELATRIGTSASWLTQLFRGDKLPNLETIAQLQKALKIEFEIKQKTEIVSVTYQKEETEDKFPNKIESKKSSWIKKIDFGNINYDEINEEMEQPARGIKNFNTQVA